MKFTCPCCGYKSLEEGENNCKVCNWINDPYQSVDPDQAEGPNSVSLRQAQHQFRRLNPAVVGFVKDAKWCAFSAPIDTGSAGNLVLRYFSPGKFA